MYAASTLATGSPVKVSSDLRGVAPSYTSSSNSADRIGPSCARLRVDRAPVLHQHCFEIDRHADWNLFGSVAVMDDSGRMVDDRDGMGRSLL